jgi:hypothetical protein
MFKAKEEIMFTAIFFLHERIKTANAIKCGGHFSSGLSCVEMT